MTLKEIFKFWKKQTPQTPQTDNLYFNKKMITKTEYNYLSKYRKQLNQAYNHNYVTSVPPRSELEKMNEIAGKYGMKDKAMNYGCSTCQLNLLKRVGKLFFEYENNKENPKTDGKKKEPKQSDEQS
jgi:hypothetical protein